jgi:hypothetical protein
MNKNKTKSEELKDFQNSMHLSLIKYYREIRSNNIKLGIQRKKRLCENSKVDM